MKRYNQDSRTNTQTTKKLVIDPTHLLQIFEQYLSLPHKFAMTIRFFSLFSNINLLKIFKQHIEAVNMLIRYTLKSGLTTMCKI